MGNDENEEQEDKTKPEKEKEERGRKRSREGGECRSGEGRKMGKEERDFNKISFIVIHTLSGAPMR